MNILNRMKFSFGILIAGWALQSQAGTVTTMKIVSAPKTVAIGACSSAVTVQAQDSSGVASAVLVKTQIFFTGSTSDLMFYSDSACATKVTSIYMAAGSSSKSFYFKDNYAGTKSLIVATYDYNDGQQYETITSGSTVTTTTTVPTTTTTLATTTTTLPTTTTTTLVSTSSAGRLYGVTIANPWSQMSAITTSLSSLAYKPTARIVFDEGVAATDYSTIASQIHKVSYVMGEILDSYYVPTVTVQGYKDRTTQYLNTLGANVDIWEIGNEINGEWLGDTATVAAKMTGAYDIVKGAGKTTALTLYFNQDCWSKADHEMFTWAQANVPDRMKTGLDYVLVSFYEDDCNGIQPDWNIVFNKLGTMFPNSKLGFGETGTVTASKKETYINRYYRDMKVTHPRFIWGDFWWYFDMQQNGGTGDMVPATNYLWSVLNNAIKASTAATTTTTSTTTVTTTTAHATSTSTVLFSENFSGLPTNTCFADGSTFGSWLSSFSGYGCNSVVNLTEGPALSLKPQASAVSSETHAGLAVSPRFSGNITIEATVKTQQQLRTGTAANAWEVGWLLWNYTDDTHFYYFIAKPNGWELGKEDPAYPGAQRFLAAGSSPTYPIGTRNNIKVVQSSNVITVFVNGVKVTTFTDTQTPYTAGKVGLYSEDALVYWKSVKVSTP